LDIRAVSRSFTKKLGAEEDVSGDHLYYYLEYKGSQYTVGKLSHSWSGSLNDTQVGMLARKLHLKKKEFEQFFSCTLDAKSTIELWQNQLKS
jgi:hypothetical protein